MIIIVLVLPFPDRQKMQAVSRNTHEEEPEGGFIEEKTDEDRKEGDEKGNKEGEEKVSSH